MGSNLVVNFCLCASSLRELNTLTYENLYQISLDIYCTNNISASKKRLNRVFVNDPFFGLLWLNFQVKYSLED